MLKSKIICYIFFTALMLFLSPNYIVAGTNDSLPEARKYPTIISYFYEKNFIHGKQEIQSIDTILSNVDNIHPALDLHYNFLGTNGSAAMSQVFHPAFAPFTFTGNHSYDLEMIATDSIRYFKTNKRFSEINYHSAAFKELAISVFHSQNITRNWNAGFFFDRSSVKDYMKSSDTYRGKFALFTWYHTMNNKYNLFAHGIWNSVKNQVSGGLASDSIFDNTTVTNLGIQGLPCRLTNAEQHQQSKIFKLSQYYDLGYIEKDSTGEIINKSIALRLHHEISFERKSFTYLDSDPDSSFYSNFYYGTATYDSLYSDEIKNRVSVQLPSDTIYKSSFFRNVSAGFFAEWQNVKYGQQTDTSWNNFSVGANAILKTNRDGIEISGDGMYVMSGMDEGNYRIEAKAVTPRFTFGRIGLNINTGQSSPDFNYQMYEGNNFKWRTGYSPFTYLEFGAAYELSKYNFLIKLNQLSIGDYVYLNEEAMPDKYKDRLSINQVMLVKNFIYRSWHFDNNFVYQKTDKEDIIRLPEYVTIQSLYYEKYYFRKALKAAIGIKANYNSSYYSDAFMPANAMFYIQNEKKTGGYVRFDLFIDTKIKTANIFIRVENIADEIIARGYYLTPHYPMPGMVFKFGVRWRFFD